MITTLQITDDFKTTVEIDGDSDSNHALVFSHGFGVRRDTRGLFTVIVHNLGTGFLCVMFDYTQVLSNDDTKVLSIDTMILTLQKVVAYIKQEYQYLDTMTVIAHSMGSVIASLAKLDGIERFILLAPPIDNIHPRFKRDFASRTGTKWSETSTIEIARSDGSTTFLEQDFLADLRRVNPLAGYAQLADQVPVTIIQAADDHIVTDSYEPVKDIEKIQLLRIPGKHNFEGEARAELVKLIRRLVN